MKIMVINPNSTAAMTAQIEESARRCAFAGTVIEAVNPKGTPASIEGHADEALSVPAMLLSRSASSFLPKSPCPHRLS